MGERHHALEALALVVGAGAGFIDKELCQVQVVGGGVFFDGAALAGLNA